MFKKPTIKDKIIDALEKNDAIEFILKSYIPYGRTSIYSDFCVYNEIKFSDHTIMLQNNNNPELNLPQETINKIKLAILNILEESVS